MVGLHGPPTHPTHGTRDGVVVSQDGLTGGQLRGDESHPIGTWLAFERLNNITYASLMALRQVELIARYYDEMLRRFWVTNMSEMRLHYNHVCDVLNGSVGSLRARSLFRNAMFLGPTDKGYVPLQGTGVFGLL